MPVTRAFIIARVSRLARLSLSTRLTLLALATLCPLITLTVYSDVKLGDQREDDALRDSRAYTESVASILDNFAQDLESLALATSLSIGSQLTPISQERNQPFLAALAAETELFRAVFVTDLDGRVVAQSTGSDPGRDLSSRPYIQALKNGAETIWSGGLDGLESGQLTVAFGRRIKDPNGEVQGFLILAFYPAVLSQRLPAATEGHIVLIDQAGRQLFSSEGPFSGSTAPDLSASAAVRAALQGIQVSFESEDTPFDEGQRYGALVPIPTMNWALGYTRSRADLDASLRESLLRDMSVLALISGASVIALLLVARQISRPLRILSQAVSDLGEGRDQPMPAFRGDPDLVRLQDAFLRMRSAVRQREEDLTGQAEVLDTLEQAGALLASDLDFETTVQAVTDAGVRVTDAAFGTLFYNHAGPSGESFEQVALSAPSEAAGRGAEERLAMSALPFLPPQGALLANDVTTDTRYGNLGLVFGLKPGAQPIRSYLAVPVRAPDGSLLGGLYFANTAPGMFSKRHEQLALGIASWAAIALDNARMYEAAQARQEELLRANAAKDDFLGLVSHELRTPITVIFGGASHLLQHWPTMTEESRDALLTDVRDSGLRLSQLVQNILVLARLDRLGNDEREPVLVLRTVERITAEFRTRRPERRVQVESDGTDTIVLASQLYLEQVVMNLLSNADKYSPAEGRIRVGVTTRDGRAVVTVMDRGPGLSAEDRQRLFEPYYRGEEARRRATGFGLGLAVCKALTGAMGGELAYDPSPEGGAAFSVALPLYASDMLEPAAVPEREEDAPVQPA